MPYEADEAQLRRLISLALQQPDIIQGLHDTNLEEVDLYAKVQRSAGEIWNTAKGKIASYNDREKNVIAKEAEVFKKHLAVRPAPYIYYQRDFLDFLGGTGLIIAADLVLALVICGFVDGWKFTFSKLGTMAVGLPLASALVTAIALIVISILMYSSKSQKQARELAEEANKEKIWENNLKVEQDKSGLTQLQIELKAAKEDLDKVLLEKINGLLRDYFSEETDDSFETRLKIYRAPGLAEVFDKAAAIETSAKESLQFMLNNMPGGSIGIAGPRGAGKTTLLRLFCGKKKILDRLKDKDVLPVLVSAPVEYQARDFILYLFAATCRSFLDYKKVSYEQPRAPREPFAETQANSLPFLERLRPLWHFFFKIGTALVLLSLVVALVLAISSWLTASGQPATTARARTNDAQTAPSPAASPDAQMPSTTTQPASPEQQKTPSSEWFVITFLKALEVKPGAIFAWGLYSIVAGLLLAAITGVRITEIIDRLPLMPRFLKRYLFNRFFREAVMREDQEWEREQHREMANQQRNVREEEKDLTGVALDWLGRIKFQQSYTSGWSGALKLPIGLEGSTNRALTLAENQLSLPEIVDAFTRFLTRVSDQCQVIIGIDELDKLESDEKAQRFLNEIKSVFGLDRCFYLISVSENAMSSFERRGLPFRDVFDSSFDTIIYVDYLDYAGAENLIKKRIVGKPIPFFALSYCLSGGLARDMIRIFRSLVELLQAHPQQNDLETLCRALIKSDLKAKLRAAAITAKKIELETEVDELLVKLYQIESAPLSEDSLLKAVQDLFPSHLVGALQARPKSKDKETLSNYEKLDSLREESATYIYYLLTILQFFNNSLTKSALTTKNEGATLDYLARARQMLAVNPGITRIMLNVFRDKHSLHGIYSPVNPAAQDNGHPQVRAASAVLSELFSELLLSLSPKEET